MSQTHDLQFNPSKTVEELEAYLSEEARMTEVDPILIFDGGDHLTWDPNIYSIITRYNQLAPAAPIVIAHTSLDEYQAEALSQADRITLRIEGELREAGYYPASQDQQDVIPGVLSSRVWIKQKNAECQAALCHWVEPLHAMTSTLLSDQNEDRSFIDLAWKWLAAESPP